MRGKADRADRSRERIESADQAVYQPSKKKKMPVHFLKSALHTSLQLDVTTARGEGNSDVLFLVADHRPSTSDR
eukprot:36344-Rhodomonas_salina.1